MVPLGKGLYRVKGFSKLLAAAVASFAAQAASDLPFTHLGDRRAPRVPAACPEFR